MAKIRTHYQNLKVDPKAPDSVIKAGYRAMSLKYHPDRRASDPDAERLFKLIQESYEILSDPIKRRKHDDWIARQEAKTTQQRKYQDEAKDRRNRERDTHKDNTKKENKSNYTTVRKTNYFSPAFVVLLIFAIGSTYQMWEWSRTGAIDDFLDQYLDRRIDTVSTSSDSIVADSNEVVTTASVNEQEPEVNSEEIIPPEVIETEQIINDVAATIYTLTASANAVDEGDSGQSNLVFNLSLDKAATIATVVNYETRTRGTATSGSDFDSTSGLVAFVAGEQNASVTVKVNGDTMIETDETVNVIFSGSDLVDSVSASGTILADDPIPRVKDVLLDFYGKANGDNWTNNDGWGDGYYCDWYGITCDGVLEVTEIELMDNNISGVISSKIGDLTSLRKLVLDNWPSAFQDGTGASIGLKGVIPLGVSSLVNLEELNLSNNALSGSIPPLGKLTSLKRLTLLNNRTLSGAIPEELGLLVELRVLDLGNNNLDGTIPEELGSLEYLEYLGLGANNLDGSIPDELGKLVNLGLLGVGNNNLSGSIPLSFENLSNLYSLHLQDNSLTGVVPPFILEMDIANLDLEGNNFDAEISTSQELVDSLNTLNEMHENGLLTDEELELARRKILQ